MKRLIYEFRQQPVIGSVTVIGTALAVFMIMVVVMMQQVKLAPFPPESNRELTLHGHNVHMRGINGNEGEMSMCTSLAYLKEIYDDMPGVVETSYFVTEMGRTDAMVPGGKPFAADVRYVDDAFFRIFDFAFLSGHPFDRGVSEAGQRVAVICESLARSLFGTADAAGREFRLNQRSFTVSGVVRDVSTLSTDAYGQVFVPYTTTENPGLTWSIMGMGGPFECFLLVKDAADIPAVKAETERRIALKSSSLASENLEIVYHGQPYTLQEYILPHGSNTTPETEHEKVKNLAIYLILLIIPAINLSAMTRSRLNRRVSEIGVRRAFGATRSRMVTDILVENLAVTLIGGAIGVVFSMAFAYLFSSIFISAGVPSGTMILEPARLLRWSTMAWALLFCFMLNLLSSGLPAWRASRINPVNALTGKTA